MKTFWAKYVREPFLRALAEVPWFGPVVSAVLIALLVNILTEALTVWGGLWLGWGAVGLEGAYPIEHVPTAFDAAGQPTGPLPPIQIRVQRGAGGPALGKEG